MSLQVAGFQSESYKVRTTMYSGPLDLLLDLIERSELDITRLSLAQVTDQYLDYLDHLEDHDPAEVSAFLIIAARLVQIKSSALLPKPPPVEGEAAEIDDGEALARQLILYRRFKQIAHLLEERQAAGLRNYLRLAPPAFQVESRLGMTGTSINDLLQAAWQIFAVKSSLPVLAEVVAMPRVTIREKIHAIVQALRVAGSTSFDEVLKGKSRIEIVVTFLAVLELIKQQMIEVSQQGLFDKITLEPVGVLDDSIDQELEFGE